jgi:HSP20 family protein
MVGSSSAPWPLGRESRREKEGKLAERRPSPFGEIVSLREAMDRLMAESFLRARPIFRVPGASAMDVPIDLYDAGDEFILRAVLPGVRPDDVQVTMLGSTLRIKGHVDMHRADPTSNVTWLVHEIPHGDFVRTVDLPQRGDPERASASFEAGILTLRLPKAGETRPRQIQITTTTGPTVGKEPADG